MRDTTIYKVKQWLVVFDDFHKSGLSREQYCNQNNITRDQYYYWLHKCRTYLKGTNEGKVIFSELKSPVPVDNAPVKNDFAVTEREVMQPVSMNSSTDISHPQIKLRINHIDVDIMEGTSITLIKNVVEVLSYAEGLGK